jgi:hypothetical protein
LQELASKPEIFREIPRSPAWPARCKGELRRALELGNSNTMPNTSMHCTATAAAGTVPSGDDLMRALIGAASTLCESTPRLSECRVLAYRDSLPPGLVGSFVPVLGQDSSIHVGILSDVCSCDALAWLLEGGVTRSDLETRTALSNLTQRLARGLAMTSGCGALTVGEAVFVDGIIRRTRNACIRAVEVVFGVTRATLVVTGPEALIQSDWPGMDRGKRSRTERERA